MVKKRAWSVIAIAVIVLLTAVCGVYRDSGPSGPPIPLATAPTLSQKLPDPVGLSPDGRKVASWDRRFSQLEIIQNVGSVPPVVLNSSHCVNRVPEAQFSWDGKQIAGGCVVDELTVWNTVTGEATNHLRCRISPYFVAAWSRDGNYLAATCELEKITVWELPSGKEIATFGPHNGTVTQLAFTPQGQLLSSGSDGWLRFEDLSGHILRSHQFGDMVKGFILRSDGKQVVVDTASLSQNKTRLYVWDLDSGKQRRVTGMDWNSLGLLALSPDGSFVILRTHMFVAAFSLRQNHYTRALGEGVRAAVFTKPNRIVGIDYNSIMSWSCCTK